MRVRVPAPLTLVLWTTACTPSVDDTATSGAAGSATSSGDQADPTTTGSTITASSSSSTTQDTTTDAPSTGGSGTTTTASNTAGTSAGSVGTDGDTDTEGPRCEAQATSLCGTQASIIRGTVELPEGETSEGNLVLALMHRRYGNPGVGGHPHWMWTFPQVDLSEPYTFEIDMCEGNAVMWSEENCEYNLIALLDGNANNGLSGSQGAVPDLAEPTAVHVLDLSCNAEGPTCVALTLECVDGAACVTYDDPGECPCAEDACPSEAAICSL